MSDLVRVRLLGGFDASSGERRVPSGSWRLRKAKTLVKLLALEPSHAMHVEQAIDALWPDLDGSAARNNLHQALYVARRALRTLEVDGGTVLTLHDDLLALGREVAVVVDVDELRAAVRDAAAAGDAEGVVALLQDSSAELLPEDAYEPWLQPHVAAFRAWRTEVVLEVAGQQVAAGAGEKAVVLLTPVVVAEPLNEPAVRALMQALAASGRRSEALMVYERTRGKLQEELASDPEADTRALFRQLLTGPSPGPVTAVVPSQGPAGNLPAPMSSLVGRGRELAEVKATLSRARLLTLTGMGGVGKTSLALSLARSQAGDFPHGAYLVELAAVHEGDQVAPQLARTLQLALPADSSPLEATVAQLRTRHALIVLDNCEHLIDACAAVVTALLRGCPNLRIVTTSREPLRVEGEVSWRTPSLALPDPECADPDEMTDIPSVDLFVQRAAAARPGFTLTHANAAAVATICHRLDGIPLALELAAACVPMLAPEEIAVRLGDAMALLRHGDRALTRQQTLEATLTWSHDLLSQAEQLLFRRLGVFTGSFTMDAVEAICSDTLPNAVVLSALARLVDTSLVATEVRGEATRYRLLDTVRQYAVQRLRASHEMDDLQRRHCDWYLAYAVARDPELRALTQVAPASLDVEHDNLRSALSWALAHEPVVALALTVSLWRYWLARGFLAEGRTWVEAALAAVPDPSPDRARALIALGAFEVRRGTSARLRELGAEAVAIHRSLHDLPGLAQSLSADALLAYLTGEWDDCWQRTTEAREAAAGSGAAELEISAVHVQGMVLAAQGRWDEARDALEEARAMLSLADGTLHPFLRLLSQGFVVDIMAPADARVYFEETVLHGRIVGAQQADAHLLCNLADVHRATGDLEAALDAARRSEDLFTRIADADGEAVALSRRGCLHRVRGEYEASREALTRSLELRRLSGERRAIGLTRTNLALLAAAEGDIDGARRSIEQQISRAAETRDIPAQAGMTLTLASAEADAGDDEAAHAHLSALLATEVWSIPGCDRPLTWALIMQAALLERHGDAAEAEKVRHDARVRFNRLGIVDGVAALERRGTARRT